MPHLGALRCCRCSVSAEHHHRTSPAPFAEAPLGARGPGVLTYYSPWEGVFLQIRSPTVSWAAPQKGSRSSEAILLLYCTLVRPYLEYCAQHWKGMDLLEQVQRSHRNDWRAGAPLL